MVGEHLCGVDREITLASLGARYNDEVVLNFAENVGYHITVIVFC